eukprot:777213-Rhodomonas_salina.2
MLSTRVLRDVRYWPTRVLCDIRYWNSVLVLSAYALLTRSAVLIQRTGTMLPMRVLGDVQYRPARALRDVRY